MIVGRLARHRKALVLRNNSRAPLARPVRYGVPGRGRAHLGAVIEEANEGWHWLPGAARLLVCPRHEIKPGSVAAVGTVAHTLEEPRALVLPASGLPSLPARLVMPTLAKLVCFADSSWRLAPH